MPVYCAGSRCKHPTLGLQDGDGGIKRCPDCSQKIHDPCAIEDEDAEQCKMNICPDCFNVRNKKTPAQLDLPTGTMSVRSNGEA
jgi:hypothetical protein